MHKILAFLVFGCAFLATTAQQYNYVKRLAGTGNDNCTDVVSDQQGYIYTCGSFEGMFGVADILPLYNISNFGSDAFLTKIDARSGKPVWAKSAGGGNPHRLPAGDP